MKLLKNFAACAVVLTLVGCATKPPYDYTYFRNSDPRSILVLPPKNSSPDVTATYGFYSNTQRPLSEAGFYVLPVTVVDEVFKANGISVADEMHLVSTKKLNEIFGADAGLYINIKDYGTKYFVIGSAAVVTAEAKLIDLKTGVLLWEGVATASSEEGQNNQQGSLAALLVTAIVKQIVGTAVDQSFQTGKITSARLFTAGLKNGLLHGPRSPLYKK
jgi:hypothetical protein